MSGKVARSQIPTLSRSSLPGDVRVALSQLVAAVSAGRQLQEFGNRNLRLEGVGSPLPRLANGCCYYEFQVGAAHPGDARPAGSRRLVAEVVVKARQVRAVYFSDGHYRKGTFRRIV